MQLSSINTKYSTSNGETPKNITSVLDITDREKDKYLNKIEKIIEKKILRCLWLVTACKNL